MKPAEGSSVEPLPSGTVTFVFTDIEGSTSRWEHDRPAMQDAVRRHDVLVRSAIEEHGGHVFKTVGDAFCAAFARPELAIGAAAAVQSALQAEDFHATDGLAVRIAVHTGTADERGGDYFGPAVNRVARLLAIGHGGQVLISGVTVDIAIADLPHNATLRDLGQHRLKDLERPEHVYQLVQRGLRTEFPALRSLGGLPNNLPMSLTSFVGRETEINEITELIARHRIVTLVGSGGVGKTRVSLQVAANLLDGTGSGVWFVELAQLADGALIPSTVATAMGIVLPSGDPVVGLTSVLRDLRLLIVLDNCEHLIDAAAGLAAAIAARCADVRILASSRQPLAIPGEVPYRLPSLAVPDDAEAPSVEAATRWSAVVLFAERARVTDHTFTLTGENVRIVADICRQLDGIPLAIELAAARVAVLSLPQLRARLSERFRLLTGTNRATLPRQQTLRALIDWSYDLLSEAERTFFDRFSVFAGSCTFEALEAVCSGPPIEDADIFDLLVSLVDKSLIVTDAAEHANRYRMLESVRAYAAERLERRGERAALVANHLNYYRGRAVAARRRYQESVREAEYATIFEELENIRAAVDRALEPGGDRQAGAALVCDVPWQHRSFREHYDRLAAFADCDFSADPELEAQFHIARTASLSNNGEDAAAVDANGRAIEAARRSGNTALIVRAIVGSAARSDQGLAAASEAEAVLGEAQPPAYLLMQILSCRAYALMFVGDPEAVPLYDELVRRHRALGNDRVVGIMMHNLADALDSAGNGERAVTVARENIGQLVQQREFNHATRVMANLIGYLTALDRFEDVWDVVRQARSTHADHFNEFNTALMTCHLAAVAAACGDLPKAAVLLGFSHATLARLGSRSELSDARSRARARLFLESLPADRRATLEARGAALTHAEAFALATDEAASV